MATERTHLDARLLTAAGYVRPGTVVADIGCDHGKLSIHLAKSGDHPKVIAADLRPEPLARARENVARANCTGLVELRLGDGLSVLAPGEAQDIIIAGMGAETILQVLEAAPWVADPAVNLVLVPATKHSLLRRWLARQGFALLADTLVEAAGRIYTVLNARYAGQRREPSGFWCVAGETVGALRPDYLRGQTAKLRKYRLGVTRPEEAAQVDALIGELEDAYVQL